MLTFAQKPKVPQQVTPAKPTIPGRAYFWHRQEVNSILHLQRTIGNQAVQRLVQAHTEERNTGSAITASTRFAYDFSRIPVYPYAPGGIQPKLMIDTPGDLYEQEADRVSEQMMRMPEHHAVNGAPPRIQRFSGQWNEQTAVPPSVDQALVSPGRPLEPALRQDMEQRFGHDFSRVRVHSDAVAEQSARDVYAHAYTVGHNMMFGAGKFAPETNEGQRLIAHELTHVVQQTGSNAGIQRKSNECQTLSDDKILGREDIIARIEEAIERALNHPPFTKAMYEEYFIQKACAEQLCSSESSSECELCKLPENKKFFSMSSVPYKDWDDYPHLHNSKYRECFFYVDAGFSPSAIIMSDFPWRVLSPEVPPSAVATFHTHPPGPSANIPSDEDLTTVKNNPDMKHFIITNREVILIGSTDRWPLSQLKKCSKQ